MVFLRSLVNVLAAAIERTLREEQIRHQALHDSLTGLLAALAQRLRDVVRQLDTVARFGGDEFVVVAEDIDDDLEAIGLAERLTAQLSRPFVISDGAHSVTASIGVAVARAGQGAPDALLRDADAAMYRAKRKGGAGHQVFDSGMRDRAVARLRAGQRPAHRDRPPRVRARLPADHLPEHRCCRGRRGAAALERQDGRVDRSRRAHRRRRGERPGPANRHLGPDPGDRTRRGLAGERQRSVAVSERVLPPARLLAVRALVAGLLTDLRLGPERLMLEITETALADDGNGAVVTIAALDEMGVRLALDDFGTGLSPLHHLLRFPIHALKVDRSFIAPLPCSPHARAIIAAVTTMAHELGKVVIAEGVETDAQLAAVTELGCDFAQGYLLGRPGTEPELIARLNT